MFGAEMRDRLGWKGLGRAWRTALPPCRCIPLHRSFLHHQSTAAFCHGIPAQLATRLCQYLRPKIHPLLLDGTINSPQTVRLNVYQVRAAGCLEVTPPIVGRVAGDGSRLRAQPPCAGNHEAPTAARHPGPQSSPPQPFCLPLCGRPSCWLP